jgi:methionine biosynthesis protein MetW
MFILSEAIYKILYDEVAPNTRVLDLGCGEGYLLNILIKDKKVIGHGIEISSDAITKCIEKGIPVIQWNLNDLPLDFPDKLYDITVLNQTLIEIEKPKDMILEMLRIGKEGLLGFSNFGSLFYRLSFFFFFKFPVSKTYKWYNTPSIHSLTIRDFREFCESYDIHIKKSIFLKKSFFSNNYKRIKFFVNLRADIAIFRICKID